MASIYNELQNSLKKNKGPAVARAMPKEAPKPVEKPVMNVEKPMKPVKKPAEKAPKKKMKTNMVEFKRPKKALTEKSNKLSSGRQKFNKALDEKRGLIKEQTGQYQNYQKELEKIQEDRLKSGQQMLQIQQEKQDLMNNLKTITDNEFERTNKRYEELRQRKAEVFDKIEPAERKKLINSSSVNGAILEGLLKLTGAFFTSDAYRGGLDNPHKGENSFLALQQKEIENDYMRQKEKNSELGQMLKLYEKEIGNEQAVLDRYKLENLALLQSKMDYAAQIETNAQKKQAYLKNSMEIGNAISGLKEKSNAVDISQAESEIQRETDAAVAQAKLQQMYFDRQTSVLLQKMKGDQAREQALLKEKQKGEEEKNKAPLWIVPYTSDTGENAQVSVVPKDKKLIKDFTDAKINSEKSIKTSSDLLTNLSKFSGKYWKTKRASWTPPALGTEEYKDFTALKAGLTRLKVQDRISMTGGGNISDREQVMLDKIVGATDKDIYSGATTKLLKEFFSSRKENYKTELMNYTDFEGVEDVRKKEKIANKIADELFNPIFRELE